MEISLVDGSVFWRCNKYSSEYKCTANVRTSGNQANDQVLKFVPNNANCQHNHPIEGVAREKKLTEMKLLFCMNRALIDRLKIFVVRFGLSRLGELDEYCLDELMECVLKKKHHWQDVYCCEFVDCESERVCLSCLKCAEDDFGFPIVLDHGRIVISLDELKSETA